MPLDPDELASTRWSLISRLKNWEDQTSWREFFDTYWRLIHSVAVKAGLTDTEAQDVVQETVLTVAKKIGQFKTGTAHGSFKAWLLHTARWKIADQFQKRLVRGTEACRQRDDTGSTATIDKVPEPASLILETIWDDEWEHNLKAASVENVRRKVEPEEFQIFDLCVLRACPVKQVAQKMGVKIWKVYFVQKKLSNLLQREARKLKAMSHNL